MRIIAGQFRGRTLAAPKGDGTRPTTDRVRESLMSAVFSQRGGFEDAVVLDAFAGSGALGLEALSRGAARAVFYECAPEAAKVVQKNVANLGLEPARATVTRADVIERAPQFARPPFDLIFLDPPYAYDAMAVLGMVAAWWSAVWRRRMPSSFTSIPLPAMIRQPWRRLSSASSLRPVRSTAILP